MTLYEKTQPNVKMDLDFYVDADICGLFTRKGDDSNADAARSCTSSHRKCSPVEWLPLRLEIPTAIIDYLLRP